MAYWQYWADFQAYRKWNLSKVILQNVIEFVIISNKSWCIHTHTHFQSNKWKRTRLRFGCSEMLQLSCYGFIIGHSLCNQSRIGHGWFHNILYASIEWWNWQPATQYRFHLQRSIWLWSFFSNMKLINQMPFRSTHHIFKYKPKKAIESYH